MKKIKLKQNLTTTIDDEDYKKVIQYKWYAFKGKGQNTYYVHSPKQRVYLHRFLLNAPKELTVDHIDGNGLNNCKSNLRLCTIGENCRNQRPYRLTTSSYKGIYWHKAAKKWHAQICCEGQHYYLGIYNNEIEAAREYDKKAKELHGEFALTNF